MAARPPGQFVAPTHGTPGAGSSAGAISAYGSPSRSRCWCCASDSSGTTRTAPRVGRVASTSSHCRADRPSPCVADTTRPIPTGCRACSAPRTSSIAHGPSNSPITKSIRPPAASPVAAARAPRAAPGYPRCSSSRSTFARVRDATSERSCSTLDTVDTDTPAARAISASVAPPTDPAALSGEGTMSSVEGAFSGGGAMSSGEGALSGGGAGSSAEGAFSGAEVRGRLGCWSAVIVGAAPFARGGGRCEKYRERRGVAHRAVSREGPQAVPLSASSRTFPPRWLVAQFLPQPGGWEVPQRPWVVHFPR